MKIARGCVREQTQVSRAKEPAFKAFLLKKKSNQNSASTYENKRSRFSVFI